MKTLAQNCEPTDLETKIKQAQGKTKTLLNDTGRLRIHLQLLAFLKAQRSPDRLREIESERGLRQ